MMSDMMRRWHYMAAVQWNLYTYACGLGTIRSDTPQGPLKIKGKSYWPMPLHQTCQLTMWIFISQDCYIVNTTNKYACWSSATPCRGLLCCCNWNIYACWPSVTVTNTAAVQTCLLVECCCKMDACLTVTTQLACLPTFCHSILPLVLLVWCLTIIRAC